MMVYVGINQIVSSIIDAYSVPLFLYIFLETLTYPFFCRVCIINLFDSFLSKITTLSVCSNYQICPVAVHLFYFLFPFYTSPYILD